MNVVRFNPDRANQMIRHMGEHPTVTFGTENEWKEFEKDHGQQLQLKVIVWGRETTIGEAEKGVKRGEGSALIFMTEDGAPVVLPNDSRKQEAEYVFSVGYMHKILGDHPLVNDIKNAIRTNLKHRRKRMLPPRKTVFLKR